MVALTRCWTASADESSDVDDSDSDSWSHAGSGGDDDVDDEVDDFCVLNVTVCDSLNAVCL